jgi:polyferredoxin
LKLKAGQLLELRPAGWLRHVRWRWQDSGHAAVILAALLMAFTHLRGIPWVRHLHHAALVAYVGFAAGEMLSQSLLGGWAGHGTPWQTAPGLLLLAAVALLAPVLTGRQLYCHHICPHGALQQLLAKRLPIQWRVPRRLDFLLGLLPYALLIFVLLTIIRGWSVNLNALEPFDAYLIKVAGWGTLAVAVIGLVAALFTPLAYCKYGCPTGAVFRLLRFTGDRDRLGLRDWIAAAVLGAALLMVQLG